MKNNTVMKFLKKCFRSMKLPITEQVIKENGYAIRSNIKCEGITIIANAGYNRQNDATTLKVFLLDRSDMNSRHDIHAFVNGINAYFMDVCTLSLHPSGFIVNSAVLYCTSQFLDEKQLISTLDRLINLGLLSHKLIVREIKPLDFAMEDFSLINPDIGNYLNGMKFCFRKEGLAITPDGQERSVTRDPRYVGAFQSGFEIDSEIELLIDVKLHPWLNAVTLEISGFPKVKKENLNDTLYLLDGLHQIGDKGCWCVIPRTDELTFKTAYMWDVGSFHELQFRYHIRNLIKSFRILYPLVTNPAFLGKDITEIYYDFFDNQQEEWEWLVMD